MKKQILFLLIVMPFLLIGCEKESFLSVDQTSINISDAGGSSTVSLTANKPWTASSNQSWCKVSPSSGEEATSSRITISCDPNTTYDARNATVTFTCAELTKQVSITQTMNNGLMVTQTSYELTKAAQQLNIEVKANVKFSVEVDSGCKDWVKYNTTKGLTTSTVVLDIAENKSYDGREGNVTIKQDGGSLSSTVTIKQSQLDGLFLTTSEYNLSNEKHTLTVEVSTNVEFDVKPEADWVKYVQTKGLSTKQIVLEVAANDTYNQRETKVNVKQKNGDLSGTITIKQDEKYGFVLSKTEFNLTNEAQNIDVEVKYNVDFEVVIPDGCKEWIKQVSTKGLNTKNHTFSIAKNETYDNREGSITFKQKKGSLSETVAINQAQTDYLEVAKNEYTVDIEGETITIEVTSNVDYTVSISEDAQSWLSKVGTKGLSKDNMQIAVAAGDDNTDRMGEIVISYGDLKRTIMVHQYSYAANTYIQFADEKIKAKLVEAFDSNKDGELSIKEARDVKSIEGVFGAIKTYKSFDEFQYFTGVTIIPDNMFENWRITSIVLPQSIQDIGKAAFKNCSVLNRIVINNGVTHIGLGCFYGCQSLMEIVIPDSIRFIESRVGIYYKDYLNYTIYDCGEGTFQCCSSLKRVSLGKGIEELQDGIFYDCKNLSDVDIKGEIKEIGRAAFYGCTNLTLLMIPDSVTSIGGYAFADCSSLTSMVIPDSVTSIGYQSFYGCSSLVSVIIPDSVTSIGYQSFKGCTSLASVVIPNSVTSLDNTFDGCTSLSSVVIPNSVTSLDNTFKGCTSLSSVVIPNSVTSLDNTFDGCTSLSSVVIPNSVTSLDNTFKGCISLSSVVIPNSVTSLDNTFDGCTSLTSVIIPESVTSLGSTFANCTSLTSVIIPESVTSLNSTFYGCTSLTSVIIPESVTSLNTTFYNCSNLSSVVIPNSVTSIGPLTFYNCISLNSIMLPESVSEIGEMAFMSCSGLESIILPKSIKKLMFGTFASCSNLKKINIPEGVTEIDYGYQAQLHGLDGCFNNCTSLVEVSFPSSLTFIGSKTFENCYSLHTVNLPDNITSIEPSTFHNCKNLMTVHLPAKLQSIAGAYIKGVGIIEKIGFGAFEGCINLQSVTIPSDVTSIGGDAFKDCKSITKLVIPSKVAIIGLGAFAYCQSLSSIIIEAETPPSLWKEKGYLDAFYYTNNCPLFVPKNSIDLYKTDASWKQYSSRIQAIPE